MVVRRSSKCLFLGLDCLVAVPVEGPEGHGQSFVVVVVVVTTAVVSITG